MMFAKPKLHERVWESSQGTYIVLYTLLVDEEISAYKYLYLAILFKYKESIAAYCRPKHGKELNCSLAAWGTLRKTQVYCVLSMTPTSLSSLENNASG